jgi:hypothetical protein
LRHWSQGAVPQWLSLLVPIPLYAPPTLWSSRDPNPFDQTVPRPRLRILVDEPLRSGPVDGEGEFHGSPFADGGGTGYPDAAAVLRSYLSHPAFEVLNIASDLGGQGAVVLEEHNPAGDHDVLPVRVKTADGLRFTGIRNYGGAAREASEMAARHQLDESEARAGVLLYRIANELEADLVITDRRWLLADRERPYSKRMSNIVSPSEALALMGLYLRWHHEAIILGSAAVRWHPTSMRHSAAFIAMPAFERWNQAARA